MPTVEKLRRLLALVGVLAGEVAAAGVLHRLGGVRWLSVGWEDLGAWLVAVAPEDAVMAMLRLVALTATYWLLTTTACYTLARASRLPAAIRSVEWATLPAVRRLADRAVAVVLAGSAVTVGVPGLAAATVVAPPAVSAPADLPGDDGVRAPMRAHPPGGATVPPPTDPAPPSPGEHAVVPGDNLWTITAAALGGSPSDAEILGPWRMVIDANRDRLRSGDPDRIFPGERVVLPWSADVRPP